MSKFLEVLNMIPETKENMKELSEVCDEAMEMLKKYDVKAYNHAIHEMEEMAYKITKEEADTIVSAMKPYGKKWTYEQIKDFIGSKGITESLINWYLVMNMVYNDYHKTAEMVGKAEDADFYFSLAKDFIHDPDAKTFKVEKYFICE